ncbi:MAG: dihydroorotate dehydrogenase 2 [Actinomycetota bacterium]
MGRPWAVGRRIFFAMEPERSHLVAQRLLGLPLPWAKIGGALDDPALETDLAGLHLRNPVGLAAGFDKTLAHLGPLGDLGFGYVVGGTVTRAPREGNAKPRIVRHPERGALVNAMGLPNPGAEVAARTLARGRRTCPRIVSVADEAIDDALATVALVAPHADGLELNASCPNVSWGRDRDTESHLRDLVRVIVERTPTPLFVKLPPFAEPTEREAVLALARIAQAAGARGLTCGNTRPVEDPGLAVGRGGLSGRPLWPWTLEAVLHVLDATGGDVPVSACGGVSTVEDVAACLAAGATTVQVYTALIYEGPRLPGLLTTGLAARTAAARS